jgi:hypothetical protein
MVLNSKFFVCMEIMDRMCRDQVQANKKKIYLFNNNSGLNS